MLPICLVFYMFTLSLALDNGLAKTPPMGWSSWNHFHRNFDETLFYKTADAFVSKGLKDVGYEYLNIDGGWWEGCDTGKIVRNSTGFVAVNKKKFPNGIKTMIDYIHSKGLKYGHYTDAGTHACNKDHPMSEGYEHQDATLFASWGIDMIKVDACAVTESSEVVVKRWKDELNATGRPILFSNCRNHCIGSAWDPWCAELTNMWRTSSDIGPTWEKFIRNLDTLKGRGKYGKPGSWNDPDFLEVDNGYFAYHQTQKSLDENIAHFSMWVVTSSPLIMGNDLNKMHDDITHVITNKQAIGINQHYAINESYSGNAGDFLLAGPNNTEIWYKPLPSNAAGIALFNRNDTITQNVTVAFKDIPALDGKTSCACCNVWVGLCGLCNDNYTAELRPHQAVLLQVDYCY